jgi:hypothetical protein
MNRNWVARTLILVFALTILTGSSTVLGATQQAKQLAIDAGLSQLARTQVSSGSEGYWPYESNGTLAATGAAALAFIDEGYLPGNDVVISNVNYGDVVGRAVNYIFNRATLDPRFGVETAVYRRYAEDYNNDGVYNDPKGNNQAIYFEPGDTSRRLYTTGICTPVLYALGEAERRNTSGLQLNTVITRGSAAINGKTYAEAMQDVVDWFSFAQVEPNLGNYRGGWRYDANYSTSDNSTAQWGALPLLYAVDWGLGTPNYVIAELTRWVNYIQYTNGGSGYSYPSEMVCGAKTGGLLLQLKAIGAPISDSRVQRALSYLNSQWNTPANNYWYGNLNHPYAMWAVYKGLELYGLTGGPVNGPGYIESFGRPVQIGLGMPAAPGGFTIGYDQDPLVSLAGDWYSHYCDYLVGIQNANGSWSGYSYWTGALASGWYINIINAGGCPPPGGDPRIHLTSTVTDSCAWHRDTVHHVVTFWVGTPDVPDSTKLADEDVVIEITLSQHMAFVSASGNGEYNDLTHSVIWQVGQMQSGDERSESIETVVASTAPLSADLITRAESRASNVPEEKWGYYQTEVRTCDTAPPDPHEGCVWFDSGQITTPATSRGTAWGDFDNDGDADLLVTNIGGRNQLYRNDAGTLVLLPDWCTDVAASMSAVWGDFDNDGDLDLYVVNDGTANALYRNDGGTFTRVDAGDAADSGRGYNAAWADYDNDGWLDLYVCNVEGINRLYHNNHGLFEDAGGVTEVSGSSRGCAFGDYDNDGDQDLYVSRVGENNLFRNDNGLFVNVTAAPVNDSGEGKGVAWGDYDNDGDLDLYLVNSGGGNKLFRNDHDSGGFFTDVTDPLTRDGGYGRACAWADYNNDGWLDLFLATASGGNHLFHNTGTGFADSTCGALAATADLPSWGCAFADYDNDGDQDLSIAVGSWNGLSKLVRNDLFGGAQMSWLQLDLRGVVSNKFGVGARIVVDSGGLKQMREVSASGAYLSQAPLTASFGLADATQADVTVLWPSGTVQKVFAVPVNQRLVLVELAGTTSADNPPVPSLLTMTNHPNPFNPSTTLEFSLPRNAQVDLRILDVSGRLVSQLLTGEALSAGWHYVPWRGRDNTGKLVPSGVYFYRLQAAGEIVTGRMLLLK